MPKKKFIISSCVISNNIVLKNSKKFFSVDAANIQSFFLSVYQFLEIDYPKFYKMDNLSKLGWLGSEILIKDENLKAFNAAKTGIVLTNNNASLDTDIRYFKTIKTVASPALFVYTLANVVMGEICIRNGFKGENTFFIFDEFDAGFIEQYVQDLFDNDVVEICICGWLDVLEENYKAVLYLVSTKKEEDVLLFTKENMNAIFKSA